MCACRANIAYADDASQPGTSTIKYTRQNTGRSLSTGKALTGLPFVPAVTRQLGTSCPGPQVVDAVGDAAGTATTGTPTLNDDTLDVHDVRFATPAPGTLKVTLRAKNLSALPAPGVALGNLWRVTWSMGVGKAKQSFYLAATSNGPTLQTYSGGKVVGSTDMPAKGITGTFTEGPDGAIVWTVPTTAVGSPRAGSVLLAAAGESHGSEEANGTGVYFTAPVDRAPDVGGGAPYVVGRC